MTVGEDLAENTKHCFLVAAILFLSVKLVYLNGLPELFESFFFFFFFFLDVISYALNNCSF